MSTATVHPALTAILEKLELTDHPAILAPDAAGETAVSTNPADGNTAERPNPAEEQTLLMEEHNES